MADTVVGWDIGGAHLKVALLRDGRIADVVQLPCALWQGLDRLDAARDGALARWPDAAAHAAHAATMTGELADLFEHREQGVAAIAARLAAKLGPRSRCFAAGTWVEPAHAAAACSGTWIEPLHAAAAWRRIASANWLATARWLAGELPDALLVDVGSTTTDIVPIVAGRVAARGREDAERLTSGELVYQGVVRTPLCSLGPRIAFCGSEHNLMNELFATSADVYRLTGELDERHDQHPSADGGAKTREASARRLARMIGLDGRDASDDEWTAFAAAWRQRQLALLLDDAARVVAASALAADAPLVGAGCGDFVARSLAASLHRRYLALDALLPVDDASRAWARVAAPCVAVALLASRDGACGW